MGEKKKLERRTGGPNISFELIKAEVEKEKTRFDPKIESVKAEIAQLEERMRIRTDQLPKRAHA